MFSRGRNRPAFASAANSSGASCARATKLAKMHTQLYSGSCSYSALQSMIPRNVSTYFKGRGYKVYSDFPKGMPLVHQSVSCALPTGCLCVHPSRFGMTETRCDP